MQTNNRVLLCSKCNIETIVEKLVAPDTSIVTRIRKCPKCDKLYLTYEMRGEDLVKDIANLKEAMTELHNSSTAYDKGCSLLKAFLDKFD